MKLRSESGVLTAAAVETSSYCLVTRALPEPMRLLSQLCIPPLRFFEGQIKVRLV